jgi:hypothetical protein
MPQSQAEPTGLLNLTKPEGGRNPEIESAFSDGTPSPDDTEKAVVQTVNPQDMVVQPDASQRVRSPEI